MPMFAEVGPLVMDSEIMDKSQALIDQDERVIPCTLTASTYPFFEQAVPAAEGKAQASMAVEVEITERQCVVRLPESKEVLVAVALKEQSLFMHRNVNNKINLIPDSEHSLTL